MQDQMLNVYTVSYRPVPKPDPAVEIDEECLEEFIQELDEADATVESAKKMAKESFEEWMSQTTTQDFGRYIIDDVLRYQKMKKPKDIIPTKKEGYYTCLMENGQEIKAIFFGNENSIVPTVLLSISGEQGDTYEGYVVFVARDRKVEERVQLKEQDILKCIAKIFETWPSEETVI